MPNTMSGMGYGSTGGGASSGAATGAAIGSVVPGIGTLIGAGVGAAAGAGAGAYAEGEEGKQQAEQERMMYGEHRRMNRIQKALNAYREQKLASQLSAAQSAFSWADSLRL